mmetsp:Transcript_9256/g.19416  ORF Transcript_9256/g.19416 Transcript_9256/m.19416 type:complete len:86 (+) Transcript_9256:331-588(+)
MADQKNASFLYYLRSFLKQGEQSGNADGASRTKRKTREDIDESMDCGGYSSEMQDCSFQDNSSSGISSRIIGFLPSSKRRCSNGQ